MKISIHLLHVPADVEPRAVHQLQAKQLKRFKQLKGTRARTFVHGRLLLGDLLSQRIGDTWQLEERDSLPPRILSRVKPLPSLSISHSGDWLAIAICDHPDVELGVDIEQVRQLRDHQAAKFFCNEAQTITLGSLPVEQQGNSLVQLWTQKEAWFKARQIPILNAKLKHLNVDLMGVKRANIATSKLEQNYWLSVYANDVSNIRCCVEPSAHCSAPIIQSTLLELRWNYFSGRLANDELHENT